MRQLHVVAVSEDGRSVVLASSPGAVRGGFRVSVDDLSAALRGELGPPGPGRDREQPLTPKEIQARLRAGESPEQIAWSAGAPLDFVDRFSGPVLSERAGVLDAVQASVLDSLRSGRSVLPLGEAVALHLAGVQHLRPGSVEWRARREGTGRWLVELSWVARGRQRGAAWWWDPSVHLAVPVDAASAALGHASSTAPEITPAVARPQPSRPPSTPTGRGARVVGSPAPPARPTRASAASVRAQRAPVEAGRPATALRPQPVPAKVARVEVAVQAGAPAAATVTATPGRAAPRKAPRERVPTGEVVRARAAPAGKTGAATASPARPAPARPAPARPAPAKAAPAKTALAKTALAKTALAKTAPAKTAPVKTAPAKTAPAKTALAKTALAKTALAKTAPAKTAPAGAVPTGAVRRRARPTGAGSTGQPTTPAPVSPDPVTADAVTAAPAAPGQARRGRLRVVPMPPQTPARPPAPTWGTSPRTRRTPRSDA